jgi:predicted nucleotidyltransferase component of viral defense system
MSKMISPEKIQLEISKLAKTTKILSVNDLRMVLALERVIARVESHKKISKHFVFKGGFVLLKTINSDRFTRDVDALAIGLSRKQVPALMEEALSQDLQDGLWFGDIKTSDLVNQGPYGGYTFNVAFTIGKAPSEKDPKIKKFSRIHIDIGFGDALESVPEKQSMPSILASPASGAPVTWSIYPFEFIFAEKMEALFSRGSNNSRAKDIYDMQLIFEKIKDRTLLRRAIQKTFENRKTPVPESFLATAQDFELAVLRKAWGSVELSTGDEPFDTVWGKFLTVLRSLEA